MFCRSASFSTNRYQIQFCAESSNPASFRLIPHVPGCIKSFSSPHANLSLGGSSLAVAWKTKNPELRQTALAAAASAILAGISEPALYGVAVRLKRPLIASLISGFICGAVAGIAGLASHSMAAPGLFTSVQFFDPANPMTIVWVFGVMALSVVLSFALTLILGFEDIPVEQAAADARARQARAQASHA